MGMKNKYAFQEKLHTFRCTISIKKGYRFEEVEYLPVLLYIASQLDQGPDETCRTENQCNQEHHPQRLMLGSMGPVSQTVMYTALATITSRSRR